MRGIHRRLRPRGRPATAKAIELIRVNQTRVRRVGVDQILPPPSTYGDGTTRCVRSRRHESINEIISTKEQLLGYVAGSGTQQFSLIACGI